MEQSDIIMPVVGITGVVFAEHRGSFIATAVATQYHLS